MDDYKYLQNEFEKFKKDHYVEHMKLQTKILYLKDIFKKMNKGKSNLSHLLNVQKHTTDKTSLGYIISKLTFPRKLSLHPPKT